MSLNVYGLDTNGKSQYTIMALSWFNVIDALRSKASYSSIGVIYYRDYDALFDFPAKIGYTWSMDIDEMVLKMQISDRLKQESYDVWDRAKVIKNQDYHDGVVKGLEMASKLVAKLWKK